jgi:ACS family glucarate transporter-like MFS transporter
MGAAGIALAWLWYRSGADEPEEHARVGAPELAWIRQDSAAKRHGSAPPPTPWRALLTSRSVWALALSYGIAGYPSYVFMTWFFLYIVNVRGVEITAGGYWSALPFVLIAFMTPLGGKLSDTLTSLYGKRLGRLSVVLAGSVAAAVLIVTGARVANVELAVILLACAAGSHLFGQAPSWAATIDIVPTHSATLFGLMNTLAQLAGAISPLLTPLIAARFGWVAALDFAALMTLSAGLVWTFVRPDAPVQIDSDVLNAK